MKITKEFLEKEYACKGGYKWFLEKKETDAFKIFNMLKKEKRYNWLSWILTKLMTKEECIKYAIYAAEKVLHIFEEKYPDDKSPRKTILAAKNYLKNPNARNAAAARAARAAYAADAAYAAARAAARATDATTKEKLQLKIFNYGIKLLKKREK